MKLYLLNLAINDKNLNSEIETGRLIGAVEPGDPYQW